MKNREPKMSGLKLNNNASTEITTRALFRMPWTTTDNALTWLEPTRKCNITCDACFAANDPDSEKSLQQIENEIRAMLELRRCDGMLIAGGEPLTHPQIVDVVKIVKSYKIKPVLLTNGVGLDRELTRNLKKAGLFGFTFHVDSHQSRPEWQGKNELEINTLRQELADMVYEAGGMVCGFNMTIFPDTLEYVPGIVEWALRNVHKVQSYTLTALRLVEADAPFHYYVGGKQIDISDSVYYSPVQYKKLMFSDLASQVKKVIPGFKFCAYLGGTTLASSIKWAVGCRIASTGKSFGNFGPKTMEFLQNTHHLFKKRYLAFTKPSLNRKAKLMFFLSWFDRELRRAFGNYFKSVLKNPLLLFKRLYVQGIVVEQPTDLLSTGELDLCDGCPNKTLWKDQLISACVLEEYLKYGGPVIALPYPGKYKPDL
jgi:hypothetical protein